MEQNQAISNVQTIGRPAGFAAPFDRAHSKAAKIAQ
jgi:hypothetical protein